MESVTRCSFCITPYEAQRFSPRVLPCGHTLCSECVTILLSNSRRCPFDSIAFGPSQSSLASFPTHWAVLGVIEQKNNTPRKTNIDGKPKLPCKGKTLTPCAKNEEQKENKIQKIKETKTKGAVVKEESEQSLSQIKKPAQDQEKCNEPIKKVFIKTTDKQSKEVKNIIVEKQPGLVHQANPHSEACQREALHDTLVLPQQINPRVKETGNYPSTDEIRRELLRVLDKCLKVENILKQIREEEGWGVQGHLNQIKSVSLSQAELTERRQTLKSMRFKSYFGISKKSECLEISVEGFTPREVEVDPSDLKSVQKLMIKIERFGTLSTALEESKGSESKLLHSLLCELESVHTLDVYFNDGGAFDNSSLLWLGDIFGTYLKKIRKIKLRFGLNLLNEKSIKVLCENVLLKAVDLQSFCILLSTTRVSDGDIKTLASSLQPFSQKLEKFSIVLSGNNITDSGMDELFQMMQDASNLRILELLLSREITDKSLEFFGERVLPNLKALDSLYLKTHSFKISEKGIWSILRNLPNLNKLKVDVPYALISSKTMEAFDNEVLPKLNSLKSFSFIKHESAFIDSPDSPL